MLYSCFILLGHWEIKPGIDEHGRHLCRDKSVSGDSLPIQCKFLSLCLPKPQLPSGLAKSSGA